MFDALEQCGFPPCPGEVMVRNPLWSKTLDEFRDDFRRWLALSDETGVMNIAIFYDAEAAAGDAELLRAAKQDLIDLMHGERVHLARFARAIDAFPTPIGILQQSRHLEGGGRRARPEEGRHLSDRSWRARACAGEGPARDGHGGADRAPRRSSALSTHQFARELTEALHYLMTLRLDAQIAEAASTSLVKPGELSTMERDLLRDAFHIVKRLREMLRRHFNLAMF